MKVKFMKRTALVLVMLMLASAVMPLCSVFADEEVISDGTNVELQFTVLDIKPTPGSAVNFNPMSLVTGVVKMLAARAWQELASYSISNDVPGLGTFFKLLRTPAQRASAAQQQMIQQALKDIAEIKASVARIESQLKDVSDKIDKYETAAAFSTAANEFLGISGKYSAAWEAYEAVIKATDALPGVQDSIEEAKKQLETLNASKATLEKNKADTEAQLASAADEAVIAELTASLEKINADIATVTASIEKGNETTASLQTTLDTINAQIDAAMIRFIAICEEGGGLTFASDLSTITKLIWNTDNPTGSYLGSYEAFMRERFAFEHEITDYLKAAYETCVDTMTQMLTIYTEYYSYKKAEAPDNVLYQSYSDDYFAAVHERIIKNFDAIAKLSGFDKLMITTPYTDAEIAEFKKNDKDFVAPQQIEQKVTVGGKTYDCYKVRDNKDKFYYIIIKNTFDNKTLVYSTQPSYAAYLDMYVMDSDYKYSGTIYRPTVMLENRYTDDGKYRMIESDNVPDFITDSASVLTGLRSVSKLTKLPEDAQFIMLYHDEHVADDDEYYNVDNAYWNMRFVNITGSGSAEQVKVSSGEVMGDAKYSKTLVVYREINTDSRYNSEGVWKVLDKGELAGQTVTVKDGQTLDITSVTLNIDNVDLHILGSGKVISNPDITLTNSHVVVSAGEPTIENLNVSGRNYQREVIQVSGNARITFAGTNKFKASSKQLTGFDLYRYYAVGRPISASSGIYVTEGTTANLIIKGLTEFYGSGGGAGMCSDGTMNVTGQGNTPKIIAKGSALNDREKLMDSYISTKVAGAGVGVSFSGVDDSDDGILMNKTHDAIGTKGSYNFTGITLEASGADGGSKKTMYSEDIGGVITVSGNSEFSSAGFTSCNIDATNVRISGKIKTDKVLFTRDVYTLTADTKGSNGVTKDGVRMNIKGGGKETGWINFSNVGNDKGTTSQSANGMYYGGLDSVTFKTNADNSWYPGKITIKLKYNKTEYVLYGGRWIGSGGKSLSPDDNVYELTVKTSGAANAGTDADIFVKLQDGDGTQTSEIELSDIHNDSNAFEKGDSDTFPIYAPSDFNECCHILLESNHANASAGWKVENLTVIKVQGKGNDSGYSITPNYWYEYAKTVNFGKYPGKTGVYSVEVRTANKKQAGTDSNIYLTLHGDNYHKNTEETNISDLAGGLSSFEKGDTDILVAGFKTPGIGNVTSITVRKDNSGSGPDWYLDKIIVTEIVADGKTGNSYEFSAGREIQNESVTISGKKVVQTVKSSVIDREIIEALEKNADGSYTLKVDRDINLSEDVMELLKETGAKLTVVMQNEGKSIYGVTFDGSRIDEYTSLHLSKGYSYADGNALIDFTGGVKLPSATTITIYTENIGFIDSDAVAVFSRNEGEGWNEEFTVTGDDGTVTITLEEGKELLINKAGTDFPTGQPEKEAHDNPPTGDSMSIYLITVMFMFATIILLTQRKRRYE